MKKVPVVSWYPFSGASLSTLLTDWCSSWGNAQESRPPQTASSPPVPSDLSYWHPPRFASCWSDRASSPWHSQSHSETSAWWMCAGGRVSSRVLGCERWLISRTAAQTRWTRPVPVWVGSQLVPAASWYVSDRSGNPEEILPHHRHLRQESFCLQRSSQLDFQFLHPGHKLGQSSVISSSPRLCFLGSHLAVCLFTLKGYNGIK